MLVLVVMGFVVERFWFVNLVLVVVVLDVVVGGEGFVEGVVVDLFDFVF
jgi:hypothetical protein